MEQIKRFLQIRIWITCIIFTLVVVLGFSIIQEGWHLLVAQTIETFEELDDLENNNSKYSYFTPNELIYTEIDILLDHTLSTTRYNGYVAVLDDKYFLVFRQDNIDNKSKMILISSFFSEDNNLLFKTNVFDQIMEQEGLSLQEITTVFYPNVLVDVRGRVRSDFPIVIFWLLLVSLLAFVFTYLINDYVLLMRNKGKYKYFGKGKTLFVSNKLVLTSKALYVLKKHIKVLPIDSIREYRVDQESLKLYFENVKLDIKASCATISSFKKVLFPEILNYDHDTS